MIMLVTLDARCRGNEHIKNDKPLQDFSCSTIDSRKSHAYVLVADGHGGEKYFRSSDGSRLAVLCTVEAMNRVLKELFDFIKERNMNVIDKTLKNLCSRILIQWRDAVKTHFYENPLTDEEKKLCEELNDECIYQIYGSTLLASVYFEKYNFWFSIQIGDGKTIAFKSDNSVFYPIPEDDDMGFGVTASLCSNNAIEKIHYNFGFESLSCIFVMSDGMTDSFASEKLPDFLLNIRNNAIVDVQKTRAELIEYLPKLSEQGSGDDVSIAGIFVKANEDALNNSENSFLVQMI
ncbi:MAG: protein phosphatase 2C domain-containing protein [Treponema sp.]|nr:protein phosphatase 2C domain-containing protein [Treponema sp.]